MHDILLDWHLAVCSLLRERINWRSRVCLEILLAMAVGLMGSILCRK